MITLNSILKDHEAIIRVSEGALYGCDYLPHALQSWLEEEEQFPDGKRKNFTLVEKSTGKVCISIWLLKHVVAMTIMLGCWLPMLLLHGQLCQDSLCCPQGRWRSEGQGLGEKIHGDGWSWGQKDQPQCKIMNHKYPSQKIIWDIIRWCSSSVCSVVLCQQKQWRTHWMGL